MHRGSRLRMPSRLRSLRQRIYSAKFYYIFMVGLGISLHASIKFYKLNLCLVAEQKNLADAHLKAYNLDK